MTKRNYLSSLMKLTRAGLLAVASLAIWVALSQITFAQTDPAGINLQSGNIPMQHVFACNSDGDLIHYYWSPGDSWQAENLTEQLLKHLDTNDRTPYRLQHGLKVINGPTYSLDTPVQHVFGRNSKGELIHYYWFKQGGWKVENLTRDRSNIGDDFLMDN